MKTVKSADELLIEEYKLSAQADIKRRIAAGTFDDHAADQSRKIMRIIELAEIGSSTWEHFESLPDDMRKNIISRSATGIDKTADNADKTASQKETLK